VPGDEAFEGARVSSPSTVDELLVAEALHSIYLLLTL
jgi:hypothetical protein